MFAKKEFWFAVFFFFLAVITVIAYFKNGFASYIVTGVALFTLLGVAFLRRALK
ncbi:MAG: hypothetical protein IIZ43_01720 [Eubacterium sp.]|nr:hypothetical protein [Eubacterium sp.]